VRQLGACGERVVRCSIRPSRNSIPPKQIEGALGHPIHHTFAAITTVSVSQLQACHWR
jgi:hypothetical protein